MLEARAEGKRRGRSRTNSRVSEHAADRGNAVVGRERNLQDLEAAFERMQRGGATSFVLLSGPSGVGKS
ncbi:ATP-binding protein [Cupriavidus basilensis]